MELRNLFKENSESNTKYKTRNSQPKPKTKPTTSKKPELKHSHGGHRQRLKNQFLANGIDTLTDIQKLELLLFYSIPQKDTNPIAHLLLDKFGSIRNVLLAEPSDLMKVNGVKENTALHLKLISGLYNVINRPFNISTIDSSEAAKDYCTRLYTGINVEQFYVICISKSNVILGIKLINSGTMDEVNVQIRQITEFAISHKCNRIIVSHNHPLGLGKMSDEDCSFTYTLMCSCLINSIVLVDHVIVGVDKTISLTETNIIPKLQEKAINSLNIPITTKMLISSSSEDYIVSNRTKH